MLRRQALAESVTGHSVGPASQLTAVLLPSRMLYTGDVTRADQQNGRWSRCSNQIASRTYGTLEALSVKVLCEAA